MLISEDPMYAEPPKKTNASGHFNSSDGMSYSGFWCLNLECYNKTYVKVESPFYISKYLLPESLN